VGSGLAAASLGSAEKHASRFVDPVYCDARVFHGGPLGGGEAESVRDEGLGSACVARDPVRLVAELAGHALRGVVVAEDLGRLSSELAGNVLDVNLDPSGNVDSALGLHA